MSVELRHLRYFIALAEAKSFGRAAAALGIAQPALSQQIRRLESELDLVLFVRGNDGSHLTPAGAAFLPGARASVADVATAVETAKRAGRGAEASTHEAITALVAAGIGVSILPKRSHWLPRKGVCTVPIQDEESVVVMAWREDRRTPVASIFMGLARQVAHPDVASQSGAG